MLERGDIYWADFGAPHGSEPGFRRPVLVVQDDRFNRSAVSTAIVVVLTSNTGLADLPGNVFLPAATSGLPKDSVANMTQLATVDKQRLVDKAGGVPDYLMRDVDAGIRLVLTL